MSDTPHILVANTFFAPFSYGGATVVAEQVAQELRRQTGWQISAVSMAQRGDLLPYSLFKSECDGIANYLINLPPGRRYAEIYDNPNVTQIFAQLLETLAPDLLHAHCLQDMGAGILEAAQDRGIPVVLSVHDFWWICERQFMIRPNQSYCGQNPVQIAACRGCADNFSAAQTRLGRLRRLADIPALLTYPSRFALELNEASGLAPGRGVVWPNGVRLPQAEFFARQAARRRADPRPSFGFVGGPSHIKGWPLIRQVFSALQDTGFRLLLVEGSPDGSWWRDVSLEGLAGEVSVFPRFTQERMDDFYSEIDVLLFMSQWKETFGLAIREALARGIAVIQTDSGGTTEHEAARPERLIPIGAPAEALAAQVRAALAGGAGQPPVPTLSFADQAAAFRRLAEQVLGRS